MTRPRLGTDRSPPVPKETTRRRDDRKSALDAVIDSIEREGGAFEGPRLIQQLVSGRPVAEPVWLTPAEAKVTYRQVWTVRTASGAEVQVLLTGHRRAGSSRRSWFGINLATKAEVRVVKVLKGSGIG